MIPCILCDSSRTTAIYNHNSHFFLSCHHCGSIFRAPSNFLSAEEEKTRYLNHNNDVNDPNYQKFVSPIVDAVCNDFNSCSGLDFGAGTGPVISEILEKKGFQMTLFDPFFHPDKTALERTYDFIVCCEVIEHFHHPMTEFRLLKKILKPNGRLYCMTDPLPETIPFTDWYYKEDPTHVLFYSKANLKYICEQIGFKAITQKNRLILFEN